MLQRLYVHNFRCLENFELKLKDIPSALLIGKNGSGKSTIAAALEVFQSIGRGVNRIGDLVKPHDFTLNRSHIPKHLRSQVPMRFEVEVWLDQRFYKYELALQLPDKSNEIKILEESLSVDEQVFYSRKGAEISLKSRQEQSNFMLDWHLIALPIIQESHDDPSRIFKTWLANMLILAPIPQLMSGESHGETLRPMRNVANFGDWLSGLLSRHPAAYTIIFNYLHEIIPDICEFKNEVIGKEAKNIVVRFISMAAVKFDLNFNQLSDGEKCFFLCAVVLAANHYNQPMFCFWDEPDNYISLSEVGHLIMVLRRSFKDQGQLLIASHNEQVIRHFSNENTFLIDRRNHAEPPQIKLLDEIPLSGNLINSIICGDITL